MTKKTPTPDPIAAALAGIEKTLATLAERREALRMQIDELDHAPRLPAEIDRAAAELVRYGAAQWRDLAHIGALANPETVGWLPALAKTAATHPFELACWLHPETVAERLAADAKAAVADGLPPVGAAERRSRLATLQRDLRAVEVEAASVLDRALAAGMVPEGIAAFSDLPPEIVLMIDEPQEAA